MPGQRPPSGPYAAGHDPAGMSARPAPAAPAESLSGPPRTWTLELPAGMRLLSLNDRLHWSVKGRITRDLRIAAWTLARQAQIPPLERATVTVEYQPPPTTRRRDLDNVGPASGKPCIDGALQDAHVLAGDDTRYLTEVTYRIGEPYPKGRLVLTITEVCDV